MILAFNTDKRLLVKQKKALKAKSARDVLTEKCRNIHHGLLSSCAPLLLAVGACAAAASLLC